MCPITLCDDDAELCDGHVLNKALGVSEAKVIQRADVDNYFGHTIEPAMILRMNAEDPSRIDAEKMSRQADGIFVMTLDETQSSKACFIKDPRQQKNLIKQGRQVIVLADAQTGQPYERFPPVLLSQPLKFCEGEPVIFRITTRPVRDSAVEGAMLKAAYLALFRMRRYELLNIASLDGVRRALCGFYSDRAAAVDASSYFEDFSGCVSFVEVGPDFPDTLSDSVVLLHYATGVETHAIAQSCAFRILDNELTLVTLPLSATEEGTKYYRKLLNREKFDQCVRVAKRVTHGFYTEPTPIPLSLT